MSARVAALPRVSELEKMEWDEFFKIFDENNLAFLYQEETKGGGESRFSKFVDRDSVDDE